KILRAIAELAGVASAPTETATEPATGRGRAPSPHRDSTALSARLDPEDMRAVIDAYHAACARITRTYDGFLQCATPYATREPGRSRSNTTWSLCADDAGRPHKASQLAYIDVHFAPSAISSYLK